MKYVEPNDYIPEEIQKKFKVGKYAEPEEPDKKPEKPKENSAAVNKSIRKFVNQK